MADAVGGTVLRSDDGELYFIRDEVLSAFKVEGEGKEKLEELLSEDEEVEGFAMTSRISNTLQPTRYVSGSILASDPRNLNMAAQDVPVTVMCPWFC